MGISWINAVSPGLWPNVWQSLWIAQAEAPPTKPPNDSLPLMIMIGGVFFVFWLFFLRPQRTEQKKREDMLSAVGKGDHIVTVGGLHGKVEAIDAGANQLSIQIAPKTVVRIDRSALASVKPKGGKAKDKPSGDKEDKA